MTSKSGSSSKSGSPRAMPVDTIITRYKSAKQKLGDKVEKVEKVEKIEKVKIERVEKKSVKTYTPKHKAKPKSPVKEVIEILDDTESSEEYYPDKMRREFVPKKVQLKPRHQLTVIAQTNKRKRSTPQRGISSPKVYSEISLNSSSDSREQSPLPKRLKHLVQDVDLDMGDMIEMIEAEGELDEEDLLEILTCPSPVWWEEHPSGHDEDSLCSRRPSSADVCPSVRSQLNDLKRSTTPNVLSRRSCVSPVKEPATPRTASEVDIRLSLGDYDQKFIEKRSKLEGVLGALKGKNNSDKSGVNVDKDNNSDSNIENSSDVVSKCDFVKSNDVDTAVVDSSKVSVINTVSTDKSDIIDLISLKSNDDDTISLYEIIGSDSENDENHNEALDGNVQLDVLENMKIPIQSGGMIPEQQIDDNNDPTPETEDVDVSESAKASSVATNNKDVIDTEGSATPNTDAQAKFFFDKAWPQDEGRIKEKFASVSVIHETSVLKKAVMNLNNVSVDHFQIFQKRSRFKESTVAQNFEDNVKEYYDKNIFGKDCEEQDVLVKNDVFGNHLKSLNENSAGIDYENARNFQVIQPVINFPIHGDTFQAQSDKCRVDLNINSYTLESHKNLKIINSIPFQIESNRYLKIIQPGPNYGKTLVGRDKEIEASDNLINNSGKIIQPGPNYPKTLVSPNKEKETSDNLTKNAGKIIQPGSNYAKTLVSPNKEKETSNNLTKNAGKIIQPGPNYAKTLVSSNKDKETSNNLTKNAGKIIQSGPNYAKTLVSPNKEKETSNNLTKNAGKIIQPGPNYAKTLVSSNKEKETSNNLTKNAGKIIQSGPNYAKTLVSPNKEKETSNNITKNAGKVIKPGPKYAKTLISPNKEKETSNNLTKNAGKVIKPGPKYAKTLVSPNKEKETSSNVTHTAGSFLKINVIDNIKKVKSNNLPKKVQNRIRFEKISNEEAPKAKSNKGSLPRAGIGKYNGIGVTDSQRAGQGLKKFDGTQGRIISDSQAASNTGIPNGLDYIDVQPSDYCKGVPGNNFLVSENLNEIKVVYERSGITYEPGQGAWIFDKLETLEVTLKQSKITNNTTKGKIDSNRVVVEGKANAIRITKNDNHNNDFQNGAKRPVHIVENIQEAPSTIDTGAGDIEEQIDSFQIAASHISVPPVGIKGKRKKSAVIVGRTKGRNPTVRRSQTPKHNDATTNSQSENTGDFGQTPTDSYEHQNVHVEAESNERQNVHVDAGLNVHQNVNVITELKEHQYVHVNAESNEYQNVHVIAESSEPKNVDVDAESRQILRQIDDIVQEEKSADDYGTQPMIFDDLPDEYGKRNELGPDFNGFEGKGDLSGTGNVDNLQYDDICMPDLGGIECEDHFNLQAPNLEVSTDVFPIKCPDCVDAYQIDVNLDKQQISSNFHENQNVCMYEDISSNSSDHAYVSNQMQSINPNPGQIIGVPHVTDQFQDISYDKKNASLVGNEEPKEIHIPETGGIVEETDGTVRERNNHKNAVDMKTFGGPLTYKNYEGFEVTNFVPPTIYLVDPTAPNYHDLLTVGGCVEVQSENIDEIETNESVDESRIPSENVIPSAGNSVLIQKDKSGNESQISTSNGMLSIEVQRNENLNELQVSTNNKIQSTEYPDKELTYENNGVQMLNNDGISSMENPDEEQTNENFEEQMSNNYDKQSTGNTIEIQRNEHINEMQISTIVEIKSMDDEEQTNENFEGKMSNDSETEISTDNETQSIERTVETETNEIVEVQMSSNDEIHSAETSHEIEINKNLNELQVSANIEIQTNEKLDELEISSDDELQIADNELQPIEEAVEAQTGENFNKSILTNDEVQTSYDSNELQIDLDVQQEVRDTHSIAKSIANIQITNNYGRNYSNRINRNSEEKELTAFENTHRINSYETNETVSDYTIDNFKVSNTDNHTASDYRMTDIFKDFRNENLTYYENMATSTMQDNAIKNNRSNQRATFSNVSSNIKTSTIQDNSMKNYQFNQNVKTYNASPNIETYYKHKKKRAICNLKEKRSNEYTETYGNGLTITKVNMNNSACDFGNKICTVCRRVLKVQTQPGSELYGKTPAFTEGFLSVVMEVPGEEEPVTCDDCKAQADHIQKVQSKKVSSSVLKFRNPDESGISVIRIDTPVRSEHDRSKRLPCIRNPRINEAYSNTNLSGTDVHSVGNNDVTRTPFTRPNNVGVNYNKYKNKDINLVDINNSGEYGRYFQGNEFSQNIQQGNEIEFSQYDYDQVVVQSLTITKINPKTNEKTEGCIKNNNTSYLVRKNREESLIPVAKDIITTNAVNYGELETNENVEYQCQLLPIVMEDTVDELESQSEGINVPDIEIDSEETLSIPDSSPDTEQESSSTPPSESDEKSLKIQKFFTEIKSFFDNIKGKLETETPLAEKKKYVYKKRPKPRKYPPRMASAGNFVRGTYNMYRDKIQNSREGTVDQAPMVTVTKCPMNIANCKLHANNLSLIRNDENDNNPPRVIDNAQRNSGTFLQTTTLNNEINSSKESNNNDTQKKLHETSFLLINNEKIDSNENDTNKQKVKVITKIPSIDTQLNGPENSILLINNEKKINSKENDNKQNVNVIIKIPSIDTQLNVPENSILFINNEKIDLKENDSDKTKIISNENNNNETKVVATNCQTDNTKRDVPENNLLRANNENTTSKENDINKPKVHKNILLKTNDEKRSKKNDDSKTKHISKEKNNNEGKAKVVATERPIDDTQRNVPENSNTNVPKIKNNNEKSRSKEHNNNKFDSRTKIEKEPNNNDTKKTSGDSKERETSQHKDTSRASSKHKDTSRASSKHKDTSRASSKNKDTSRPASTHEDASRASSKHKDKSRASSKNKDTSRPASTHEDTFRASSKHKDKSRASSKNKDTSRPASTHEGTSRASSKHKDKSRASSKNRDTSRPASTHEDTSRASSKHKHKSRASSKNQDTSRPASNHKDTSRAPSKHKETSRTSSNLKNSTEINKDERNTSDDSNDSEREGNNNYTVQTLSTAPDNIKLLVKRKSEEISSSKSSESKRVKSDHESDGQNNKKLRYKSTN